MTNRASKSALDEMHHIRCKVTKKTRITVEHRVFRTSHPNWFTTQITALRIKSTHSFSYYCISDCNCSKKMIENQHATHQTMKPRTNALMKLVVGRVEGGTQRKIRRYLQTHTHTVLAFGVRSSQRKSTEKGRDVATKA